MPYHACLVQLIHVKDFRGHWLRNYPVAATLNFELQHFPVRQLAGPDRPGNLPDRTDLNTIFLDLMVKHLACYLTDHKQKSINSS